MFLIFVTLFLSVFINIYADELHISDSHGPISIMGEHMHKEDEVMFSYRFSNMRMHDLLNGEKKVALREAMNPPNSASDNSGTYMNSPVEMRMDMHMFGAMYAPNNNLTLMLMTNYVEKEMTQERMPMSGSSRFDVNSSGIGDVRVSGLIKILQDNHQNMILGFGLSIPTGSIDKRDVTPTSSNARLGYAMQNGTGTLDPFIFVNNVNNLGKFKISEQILFKTNFSKHNSKGYHYGNFIDFKSWVSYRWLKNLSTSLKINYKYQEKMFGSDNEMNKRMSPAMDSRNQGYNKLELGFGLNFINHKEFMKNNRLGIEFTFPVYQNLRGIQMSDSLNSIIGWQYSF